MTRIPEIEKAADEATAHFGGGEGFKNVDRINVYVCQGRRAIGTAISANYRPAEPSCGFRTVTVDREPGVTPFVTQCPKCKLDTQSSMYRVGPGLTPTHEWFRPDNFDGLSPGTIDHIKRGGLILREIDTKGSPVRTNLIATEWATFEARVLDRTAPAIQREEMKMAFYGGAWALLNLQRTVFDPDEEPTERDVLQMEAIAVELEAFAIAVRLGMNNGG